LFGTMAVAAKRVKVTRHGQTTIPKDLRRKLGIEEGSVLLVEVSGRTIVLRPIPRLEDLAGSLSGYATAEAVKADLDRAREDEDRRKSGSSSSGSSPRMSGPSNAHT